MNIQVHGEEGDGGWEIWKEILNTSVHSTGEFLRGFVLKLSRRIRELATRDLLDQVNCITNSGGVLIESQLVLPK